MPSSIHLKVWEKLYRSWDKQYGVLTEAFALDYSFEAMVNIFVRAEGKIVETKPIGTGFLYKYADEPETKFRLTVEDVPLEELERLLAETKY